jgi:hypothetical protein
MSWRHAIAVVCCLAAHAAHASENCMTRAEARKIYRAAHLYWYGKDHCWGVLAHGVRRAEAKAKPEAETEPHALPDPATVEATIAPPTPTTLAKPVGPPPPPPTPATAAPPAEQTLTSDGLLRWALAADLRPSGMMQSPPVAAPAIEVEATASPPLISARNIIMAIMFLVMLAALARLRST